jgi:hypothetical protein
MVWLTSKMSNRRWKFRPISGVQSSRVSTLALVEGLVKNGTMMPLLRGGRHALAFLGWLKDAVGKTPTPAEDWKEVASNDGEDFADLPCITGAEEGDDLAELLAAVGEEGFVGTDDGYPE